MMKKNEVADDTSKKQKPPNILTLQYNKIMPYCNASFVVKLVDLDN